MIYSIQRYLRVCLMALVLFIGTSLVHTQQAILSVPISIDGTSKSLEVYPGQSIENAAFDFAKNNNLFQSNDEQDINSIVSQLVNVLQTKIREQQQQQQGSRQSPQQNIAFTLPIQLDNMNTEFKVYNGKSIEESIRSYFDEYGIPNDVRMNIAQQLIETIQKKTNELQRQQQQQQQQRPPMFSLPITIDNQQVTINHYENGNPFDEARSVCLALGITSVQTMQNIIPQIANVIQKKIDEMMKPKSLIFTIPINIDGKEIPMPHYAGQSARDSVIQFLQSQNINDNEVINRYAPSLINMIDSYLQDDTTKTPLVNIPVNFSGRQLMYNYYEKADPQRSVMDFVKSVGITNQSDFENAFNQILAQLQERLAELPTVKNVSMNQENEGRNLLAVLPVSLANNIYNLQLFHDQKPEEVATWFCTDNWAAVKKQMGEAFTNEDITDCISVIHNNLIAKLQETGVVEEVSSENLVNQDQDIVKSKEATEATIESIKEDSTLANAEKSNDTVITTTENHDIVSDQESTSPPVVDNAELNQLTSEDSSEVLIPEEDLSTQKLVVDKEASQSEIEEKIHIENESKNITEITVDSEVSETAISKDNEQKDKKDSSPVSGKPLKPLKLSPKKELVFSLNIDLGDDNFAELNYYKGDKASTVAQRFCSENNLDEENIPTIIEMIEGQLS